MFAPVWIEHGLDWVEGDAGEIGTVSMLLEFAVKAWRRWRGEVRVLLELRSELGAAVVTVNCMVEAGADCVVMVCLRAGLELGFVLVIDCWFGCGFLASVVWVLDTGLIDCWELYACR